jgi:hypothetical protein
MEEGEAHMMHYLLIGMGVYAVVVLGIILRHLWRQAEDQNRRMYGRRP